MPTLVQANGAIAANVQYTTNVTAGNILFAVGSVGATTGETITCSDNINGAWTTIPGASQNSVTGSMAWFVFSGTAGGSRPTVTMSASPNPVSSILIHEVSGLKTPFVVDGAVVANGSSLAPAASLTVGAAGDFVLGYVLASGTGVVGAGFTPAATDANGDPSEYVIASASGPLSVAFTQTPTGVWNVIAFAASIPSGAVSTGATLLACSH